MEEKLIIKKSGHIEKFNEEKLCNSLVNIGLDKKTAYQICSSIYTKIPSKITSQQLNNLVLNELKKYGLNFASRYNLKRAIYRLGPTGFPFERYVGKILAEYGYETLINEWIEGSCLQYEIDIVAVKEEEKYIVECKFHNKEGEKSDLKIILYVYGRWLDIKEKFEYLKPWFITNTKITTEGLKFAQCKNIKITSWKYPEKESIEKLIESKKLYPVTILLSGNKFIYSKLINANFVLVKDLFLYDENKISRETGLTLKIIKKLKEEGGFLLY